jgi:hypothetical protein
VSVNCPATLRVAVGNEENGGNDLIKNGFTHHQDMLDHHKINHHPLTFRREKRKGDSIRRIFLDARLMVLLSPSLSLYYANPNSIVEV